MPAITADGFARTHRGPMFLSALGHIALLLAFSGSVVLLPPRPQPVQHLAIEAVLVDGSAMRRAQAAERERQAEAAQQRRAEEQRQAKLAQERRATEQRKTAAAASARRKEQEAQRVADQKAAESRKQQAAAEAERQRKQAAADRARKEEERRAAEARARAAAEERAQQRRQAELLATMEAEEALAAAEQSGAANRYKALLQQRIQRRWVQPASAIVGIQCEVSVQQLPSGEVLQARVTQCNGDATVKRSVENAVYAASPLPLPEDRRLFSRHLTITFRPEVE